MKKRATIFDSGGKGTKYRYIHLIIYWIYNMDFPTLSLTLYITR